MPASRPAPGEGTAEDFTRSVAGGLDRQSEAIARYLRTVDRRGLHAPSALARIAVEILDQRNNRADALPRFDEQ